MELQSPPFLKSLSLSVHKVDDKDDIPFSDIDYSKFKFGSKTIARKFGNELAQSFIQKLKDGLWKKELQQQGKNIVVVSSPYCFIPTATFAMKDYFVRRLNEFLVENYCKVVEETKIHRTITYKEDYGEMSAEQRLKLISGDGFHIDAEFCKGKFCLFLDDIKITGSHEKVIQGMIDGFNSKNPADPYFKDYAFLYYAELTNQDIPPQIENQLNYAYVKTLKHLDKIIKNGEFLLNTRTVKYILSYKSSDCKEFLDYQELKFLKTLYHEAIGNSYHLIPEYKVNLYYIKQLITQ